MRMRKTSVVGLVSILFLLAACSTQRNAAPVLERNAEGQMVEVPRVEATTPSSTKPAEERGYYTVKKGDTLTRIALDNGQNYRDLVTWNNLANPNDIKVDQVLRVLPPGDTGATAQVGSVAEPMAATRVPLPPTAGAAATPAAASNKSGPRGDKRPYSEAAMAELQKPDNGVAIPPSVTAPAVAVAVAPKPATDKALEAGIVEDDAVSWMWPTDGKPSGPYEEVRKGIDIPGKMGQQVMAAAAGKVLYAGVMRGYGNLVIVKHSGSLLSAYAHNKTILVKEGQAVTKGQLIAEMGDSDADSVKLHFEVRQQGKPVDPAKFLPAVK
jgi:lipoprotein NlpD